MGKPIRVLLVEDSDDDAELILRELQRGGFEIEFQRVETALAMRAALAGAEWDLVLSDYRMPDFSGSGSLQLLKESGYDIPFILVSGTIGEEAAVAALKAGAADFVLKDRLARLIPAIERELRESAARREYQRTQQTLQLTRERLHQLINASPTAIYALPLQRIEGFRPSWVSENTFKLLACKPEEIQQPGWWEERIHPDDRRRVLEGLRVHAYKEYSRDEYRFRKSDDTHIWLLDERHVYRDLLGNAVEIVGSWTNITERKKAEEALQHNEALFRTVLQTLPVGVWITDERGQIVLTNPAAEGIWGGTRHVGIEQYGEYRAWRLDTGKSLAPEDWAAARAVRNGETSVNEELEIERFDGERRIVLNSAAPVRDAQGQIVGAFAINLDITERKKAELALQRREAYFRALIENAADLISIVDRDGNTLYESPALLPLLGYEPAAAVGKNVFDYVHPHDVERIRRVFREALPREGARVRDAYRVQHTDGTWRDLESTMTVLLEDPAVQGAVINSRDVTESRRLEDQFRQAQKMEAIGRLAGGVAHDFNNLLTVIQASVEFLMADLPAGDARRGDAEEIQKAAHRAASLTRQLLAFSRRQVLQLEIVNLNIIVSDTEKMLRRLIGEDIELMTVLDPTLGTVKVDPGQMEQVLLNLAVNARDAMPRGGTLTIQTANVELDEHYAQEHAEVQPGHYTLLAVSDTGGGMPPEVREKIFEPFFTTKEYGTGLGLATVYGIVKQSGGHIWVYSELGHGATFKVYLPRVDEVAGPIGKAVRNQPEPRGNKTILLVEDEESVRRLAQRILEQQGYRVLVARTGEEALRASQAYDEPIDLLFTDVVMPKMNGKELAERVKQSRPTLRVMFASGYSDDAIINHGLLEPGIALLQKPYSSEGLLRKVREVFEAATSNEQ
ncbi:MAG: PAS domain S-box protein [Candidatus Hydrogenedentes bacterium]|nr:PAS domain S-box protein [Candidatus Hydrogenedentota bacterium]